MMILSSTSRRRTVRAVPVVRRSRRLLVDWTNCGRCSANYFTLFALFLLLSLSLVDTILLLLPSRNVVVVHGFSTSNTPSPSFGLLGSATNVLFQRPTTKGLVTKSARGKISKLLEASDFFVDAFWVGKVGGGTKTLSDRQRRQLSSLQFSEFKSRYSASNNGSRRGGGGGVKSGQSELILCTVPKPDHDEFLIGCAGIEVSSIPTTPKGLETVRAPLMSNVAVSKEYRRRGVGETLVQEAERIARLEWGYKDCYLYVEERNRAAIRLYQKLGYKRWWVDKDAKTLLPTTNGKLEVDTTRLVCMRKRLDLGVWNRLLPFVSL